MSEPKPTEFLAFGDADADRPGIVVLHPGPGEPFFATLADEQFWDLVIQQAWEEEWFLNGGYDTDPFVGRYRADVEDEWAAYVRARTKQPEWRWYVWRPNDDEDDELDAFLDPAIDENEAGAFRCAVVVLTEVVDGTGEAP